MTFVYDGDAVAAEVRQGVLGLRDADDLGDEPVAVGVVFPHADEMLGAKNQRFKGAWWVLKHAGQCCGHEGFAETDNIAKDDPTTLF